MVRDLGPLYCYSLFGFEGLNGNLLKLVHGTQQAQMQIVNSVSVMQKLPEMAYSCPRRERKPMICTVACPRTVVKMNVQPINFFF